MGNTISGKVKQNLILESDKVPICPFHEIKRNSLRFGLGSKPGVFQNTIWKVQVQVQPINLVRGVNAAVVFSGLARDEC